MNIEKKIKLVVWDLDNTLWNGILLEDENIKISDSVKNIIMEFDRRGILQSIASRNYHDHAMAKLQEEGLEEYFIFPHIGWESKSQSIGEIIKSVNISEDTVAFVDDQLFELDEVHMKYNKILCISAENISSLLEHPRFIPIRITEDSSMRRRMYQADIKRNIEKEKFEGPNEDFLKTLNMKLTIKDAKIEDLDRMLELIERTSQLNATGRIYSYDELFTLLNFSKNSLLVISLEDIYGSSGKVGLVLIDKHPGLWTIKLLIVSCRVIPRGIGTIVIHYVISKAKENNVRLLAEYIPTDRNRIILMTYTMIGFKIVEKQGNLCILENKFDNMRELPSYIHICDRAEI